MVTNIKTATYSRAAAPADKDWLRFRVPAVAQGQMVEHAYATDLQDCIAWRRTTEAGRVTYATRPLTDAEVEREECDELGAGSW